ncbi:hypothetical protein QVD17_06509 [Tagetes erecta]|uniref:Uncharacterized protein n=1 Tax=Tagetes erecta TaxID=13708 RepID=A0AAD8LNJ5_TARER|nr:hypothetical protein QVD17_06509 [Tagetes erecta]
MLTTLLGGGVVSEVEDEEGDERACGRGGKLVEKVGRDGAVRGRGGEQTRRRRGPLLLRRACDEVVPRSFLAHHSLLPYDMIIENHKS